MIVLYKSVVFFYLFLSLYCFALDIAGSVEVSCVGDTTMVLQWE